MQICTWAPTTFQGTQVVNRKRNDADVPLGTDLQKLTTTVVRNYEEMGVDHLLIAQRWWGSGEEIEASSLDCLAMTTLFAGCTERMNLITAIHPGFFSPTTIAKYGATIDRLTNGRWAINVTSGWNLQEFDMYGVDPLTHDLRYARSGEFIEVLRQAWTGQAFDYQGEFYHTQAMHLDPRPVGDLQVYQGGQSDGAIAMAAEHSDWMFINGGRPDRVAHLINRAKQAANDVGRQLRFAMYAAPLCRATDEAAWDEIDRRLGNVDRDLVERRRKRVAGAEGMWADTDDELAVLDTNEGYASRLIGSPQTINERIDEFRALGVDMLHLDLRDSLFQQEVLPDLLRR